MKDKPLVSVIIPTFNSEKFLERCLRSVKAQKYPQFEVITVDNFSRDRTGDIARKCGVKVVLYKEGRSGARNFGADYARGEFVFFVDSDMELTPFVISECIATAEKCGFDAVIVPEVSVGEGFWARCKTLEKACYIGDDLIEAARLYKKSVFEKVGGYDLELEAGEDWDLNQRIMKAGYRIGRTDRVIKHNEGRLSLRETVLKKHYYGQTLKRYRKKYPRLAKQQLGLVRPAFVRNWRKLAKDPAHALGLFFMKICEFGAGWIGIC